MKLRSRLTPAACVVLLLCAPVVADDRVLRETEWAAVELGHGLPVDLLEPAGKTRWELGGLSLGGKWVRTLSSIDSRTDLELADQSGETPPRLLRYTDPSGGDAVRRWLLPDLDPSLLSVDGLQPIVLDRKSGRATDRLSIRTRRIGLGWVFLPSGPREAVLQEALILKKSAGDRGFAPDVLIHRWIDPRAGVVAEVSGPASADGLRRTSVSAASVVQTVRQGGFPLKIFAEDVDPPILTRVTYGLDRGTTSVSALDPAAHTTIGDLVNAASWDFSAATVANSVGEIASTLSPVTQDETCNYFRCGFSPAGGKLGREDRDFDDPPNADKTLTVTQRVQRANDLTIWLRAGVRKEGISTGGLGESESRFCYTDELPGTNRTEVALWRFSHRDSPGDPYHMLVGDLWPDATDQNNGIFQCELNLFNHVCPGTTCGFGCQLWVSGRDGHAGTQRTEVVNEGPVTLPSGHTFNTQVLLNVTDLCVSTSSNCGGFLGCVQEVRTVLYLWVAPRLGTVARLMSAINAPSVAGFTEVDETDLKFGLFPPRSISAGAVTDTSIDISWDPGLITDRIDGYKVYWDTDSGSGSPYAFNSADNPGQANIVGTAATISGLTPGTGYFLTVTSLSTYANPTTLDPVPYESVVFPIRVPGSPGPVPAEVSTATTGGACTPTAPVAGVTLDKSGPSVIMSWLPAVDSCLSGYQVVSAGSPESDANFSVEIADTGLTTSVPVDTTATYFLVLTRGSGGTGPWEHYGR